MMMIQSSCPSYKKSKCKVGKTRPTWNSHRLNVVTLSIVRKYRTIRGFVMEIINFLFQINIYPSKILNFLSIIHHQLDINVKIINRFNFSPTMMIQSSLDHVLRTKRSKWRTKSEKRVQLEIPSDQIEANDKGCRGVLVTSTKIGWSRRGARHIGRNWRISNGGKQLEYSGFQRSRSLPRAWFRWKWCPRGETGNRNPRLRIIPYTLPLAPSGSATTRSRQLPTILRPPPPPPPLFPPFVAFLHFQTLSPAAILYRRQEPIYLQRSPSFTLSLSLSFSLPVLETKFKLDTANNGAPMGKYDSVISYSLCRNRLRRRIYRPRWIMDLEEWV